MQLLRSFDYGLAHFWGDEALYASADEAARLRAHGVEVPLNEFICFTTRMLATPAVGLRTQRRWLHEVALEEAFAEVQAMLAGAFRRAPRSYDLTRGIDTGTG